MAHLPLVKATHAARCAICGGLSASLSFVNQQELVCSLPLPPANEKGFMCKGITLAPTTSGSSARQGLPVARRVLEGDKMVLNLSCVKATCALRSGSLARKDLA